MKTGLFFGSFNPVHIGHMALANYFVEFTDIDQLWFVISPHNPLKKKESLLNDQMRLDMVELAINNDSRFKSCDVEFHMPKPSYTIDTITYLREMHPLKKFSLIMGNDNLSTLHKWKNIEELIKLCTIYVYPRKESKNNAGQLSQELISKADIRYVNAPLIEISGTFIRRAIKEGKDIRHLLAPQVWKYVSDMNFYR